MSTRPRRFRGSTEMASCMEVMRVLQSYLDGHTDEVTTRRVANHLDACRRCGLEAATYREIKAALERRSAQLDPGALERLRTFGAHLAEGDEHGADGSPPPA